MRIIGVFCGIALLLFSIVINACSGVGGGGSDLTSLDLGGGKDVPITDTFHDAVPDDVIGKDLPGDPQGESGKDLANPDPGPENGSLDPGTADPGTKDPGSLDPGSQDIVPIPDPVFRVSKLVVVQPGFCLDAGGAECIDVTDTVNAYVAASIGDAENPMNLLLRFVPFDLANSAANLLVGNGNCDFTNGKPTSCGFSETEKPFLFGGPLFKPCQQMSSDICFETPKKKLEMMFMGIFLALHDGVLSGKPDPNGLAITDGSIDGFVPVNTTKSIQVALPGGSSYLLYDFLKSNPVQELKGVKGFWFQFDFEAIGLDYQ